MDSPCHKLSKPHEGVRGEGGGVIVVRWGGVFGGPFLEKHVPGTGSQRSVGLLHEVWWWDVRSRWGKGV